MTQELYTVKVVSGEHEGRHRSYKAGEIFRSQYPLHELFPNKFELLPNTPAPLEEGQDTISTVLKAQDALKVRQNDGPAQSSEQSSAPNPTPSAPLSPYGEYAPYNAESFDFDNAKKITSQFKAAKDMGFDVWTTASGDFAVSEAGVKIPTNLAASVLKSKKEVRDFLNSMKTPAMPD